MGRSVFMSKAGHGQLKTGWDGADGCVAVCSFGLCLFQLCTFGVVVDAGSRDEQPGVNDGVCHLLEAMSFKSTSTRYEGTRTTFTSPERHLDKPFSTTEGDKASFLNGS